MNLKEIILDGESETLEFKKSTGEWKEIIKAICGFANTRGGKVFIGVSESGELPGIIIGKDTIENLSNKIFQNTDPKVHPHITIERIEGKSIIVIEVKESADHLVLAFGRPYKRVGKSTVKVSKDEYERLILEKHREKLYFDSQICKGVILKDINEEKIKWFLNKAKAERNLDIDLSISPEETLRRFNLITDNNLTNAAILTFGENPQRFFIQSEVRCARFKGTKAVKHTNPLLANLLFLIKYIERWGTGTNDIVKWCIEHKLPEPIFKEVAGGFAVILRKFQISESLESIELNERQEKVIEYLKKYGRITNREYQNLCPGVNRETLRKDLNDLIDKKVIVRKGEKRGIYYEFI